MKVMWVGRDEISYGDLKGLVKIAANKFITLVRWAFAGLPLRFRTLPAAAQTESASAKMALHAEAPLHSGCTGFLQGGRSRHLARDVSKAAANE